MEPSGPVQACNGIGFNIIHCTVSHGAWGSVVVKALRY